MGRKKLTEYSLDELIRKEKHHRVMLNILIGTTALLFTLVFILYSQRGFNPAVVMLLSEVPFVIQTRNRHNEIKAEIESRK